MRVTKKINSPVGIVLGLILVLPFALNFISCAPYARTPVLVCPASATGITARVIKVYEGDTFTIELADGTVDKVRLIGVDAPELQDNDNSERDAIFGKVAQDYLADLVVDEEVTLIPGVKERDNYGRILAYVYKGERCVNFEMVRIGYAYAYTVALDADDADLFLEAEREAREAGRGLWAVNR